jgi:predicted dehydrogenase
MGTIVHPRAILEANLQLRPMGLEFVLECAAGRDPQRLAQTHGVYGYNRTSTDWENEVGKVDLVVITTPKRDHAPIALAALKAGKAVVCEQPLAQNLEESRKLAAAAKKAGTPTMVTFCYQGAPGALEARRIVQGGLILGTSGYFEGTSEFLQDWGRCNPGQPHYRFLPERRWDVIEDLGANQVDLVQFILGKKIAEVSAQTRVYDGEYEDLRMIRGSDMKARNRGVDAFEAIGYFDNGCSITFRSNRTSTGHKAFFETAIHGNRGAVQWELEDQGYLKFYSHTRPEGTKVAPRERGWTNIHLSDPDTDGHHNTDTKPGLINGFLQYFRWQYVKLGQQLLGKPDKAYAVPTFADACQVSAVTDAIYRSGLKDGELTKVARVG